MIRGLRQLAMACALVAAVSSCEQTPASPPPEAKAASTSARPATTNDTAASARATLGTITGEVTVKRAAGDEWIAAREAMELFENDKLRTARGASAQLRFVSGSVLTVGEDALVGIAELRPKPGVDASDLTVLKGRIDAELADPRSQSLVVTTPSATVRAGREIVFQ